MLSHISGARISAPWGLSFHIKDRGHILNLKSLGSCPDLGTYSSRVLFGTSVSGALDLQNGRMMPRFLDGFEKQEKSHVKNKETVSYKCQLSWKVTTAFIFSGSGGGKCS